ncbi:radical SAM protein [Novosphingobium lentum]|uniref:radical SAM protein n=1 Tax=Novosphingobium lentum TaxID=145287 RepID=UPI000831BF05|nr:radical SAM protein [Novosphingobium lentum]
MSPEVSPDRAAEPETFAGWAYYPDLLERAVPRYTSYPTAAEFRDDDFAPAQLAGLRALRGPVSLYLHIPYCDRICWYCGCNTGAANRTQRLAHYLEALHREIELVAGELDSSVRVSRIAFGGGSPNAIAPTDFVRLIDRLVLNLRLDAPVLSLELDPRSLDADWFTAIRGIGIEMASLGVQTLDPGVQQAIGRVQPAATIARAVDGLRRAGVRSLNFDLMYGLPGQDDAVLADTIDRSIAMAPDRVALFGYAHVPHLIARQARIDARNLPDQRARFRMAAQGHAHLTSAGYRAIGFDHFALPDDGLARACAAGTMRRNFQGFTDDPAPVLIGLGASAISAFPGLFVQNDKNAGPYRTATAAGRLSGTRGIERSADDRARGAVIEALLCRGDATVEAALLDTVAGRLAPFIAHDLVRLDANRVILQRGSQAYARSIAAVFDSYRSEVRSFSSAV